MTKKTITLDREAILRDTAEYWRGQCAKRDATIIRQHDALEKIASGFLGDRGIFIGTTFVTFIEIARAALEATKEPQP